MNDAQSGKSSGKGSKRIAFDLDDPKLPEEIKDKALGSGGYPYDKKLKRKVYEKELVALQLELLKLEAHIEKQGQRLVVLFEGRDASGKGSCISRFLERMNPRHARSIALSKPTDTERGEWYFQRYVCHLPTRGDIVLFDRSWYNRAGVERVMDFCTPEQTDAFLRDAPDFEALLIRDGIRLFKLFLVIGREMQLKRFHERRHDPFKMWKITDIDLAAIKKWDEYSQAQREMFRFTDTPVSAWTVICANDQRRARLEAIRVVLSAMSYDGKDEAVVGKPDPLIVGSGPEFFNAD
jgi:polyphosphate kinase 2